MPFHHEKLTVYKRALEFATWSQDLIESVTKKTSTRDHLERSGDSIALNIAEGNGKFSQKDRARFFQIAHGSALEAAAIGHWFFRDAAADAANKAFITTRIGDFGFMTGILMIWMTTGSVVFAEIAPRMPMFGGHATFAAIVRF